MKKWISFMGVFIFLVFFSLSKTNAQVECIFGIENDPAPGSCGSYIDKNGNNLCDLSEVPIENNYGESGSTLTLSEEEIKAMTVKEVAEVYGIETSLYRQELSAFLKIDVNGGDSLQALHDNNGLCAGVAGNIALQIKNGVGTNNIEAKSVETNDIALVEEVELTPRYKFLPITIIMLFLYLISYILVKEKKITFLTHERIWNIVLLLSFLASAILGVLLVIRINWGWYLNLPFNIIYWHVEAGTVMATATLFHIISHWRYYSVFFISLIPARKR